MKRLLVIVLLLLGLSSCGNRKEAVAEAINDLSTVITEQDTSGVIPFTAAEDSIRTYTGTLAEILIDKYSYEIKDDVKQLIKELKSPALHVYNVFVNQQIVKSSAWCLIYIFIIIIVFVFYRVATIHKDTDYKEAFTVLTIIATIVFVVVFLATIHVVWRGFLNPEYGAIKEITNILTGKCF